MASTLKFMLLSGIILFFGNKLQAQSISPRDVIHCKVSELDQHAIREGQLVLKLFGFKYRSFRISVQNSSESFCTFSPADLTIVGNDGSQNYIETSYSLSPATVQPTTIKIAPMAHILFTYGLNTVVSLPAKIYYSEKLVAEITK
jgi:hypothetical protein